MNRYACPECGSPDNIEIAVSSWVHLDQTDPHNVQTVESSMDASHEWDNDSNASCLNCHWTGVVADMHVHVWGDLEHSRIAGTLHRKCLGDGCNVINAYDEDEDEAEIAVSLDRYLPRSNQ